MRQPQPSEQHLREIHRASEDIVRTTPVLSARSLSERCGGRISLKAENLQRTGSFKLRGALAKLRSLERPGGVVTGSAGNHAQALAYAARQAGIGCEVFMPNDASLSKLAAVTAFGATVIQEAEAVDDCVAMALERAASSDFEFVHPFDDPVIVEGQAGLGIELLDQVPDLAKVIVSVGGGGLASGTCLALKAERDGVEVVGVQAEACAGFADLLDDAGSRPLKAGATIADGIAVKRPGELTRSVLERLLDRMVSVTEEQIAQAMVVLTERSKLVVEGAGAAPLAALLSGAVEPAAHGTTVAVLSGGNVDPGLLASIVTRSETSAGRRLRLATKIPDRPGGLAELLSEIADAGANLIAVEHVREGIDLALRETAVELTLETKGPQHAERITARLGESYDVRVEVTPLA
ncbi:MAG: pyridoxal-phosphate dependent enzyme [Solirubrobacterales bacterium]|nr:pyridoxal-phosphate dependent enzyme [Solirubrobacterales bacterium]